MFKDIKDKQLFFVSVLLIIMATVALYIFLMSKGISLDSLLPFGRKQPTLVVTDPYPAKIKITSTVFENGTAIPEKYSCTGKEVNPRLSLSNVPENAKSITIIMEDPDSPYKTWTHWILYNIDPRTKEIYEGILPWNSESGENDFGVAGYRGPCPPAGTHRYFFKVYALDTRLDLEDGANRAQVEKAMEGHILDTGELVGTFEK